MCLGVPGGVQNYRSASTSIGFEGEMHQIFEELGHGAYGVVHRAVEKSECTFCSVKIVLLRFPTV